MKNVEIFIGTFHDVKSMRAGTLPISVSRTDPGWFHANAGAKHVYKNMHGVFCGVKFQQFMPKTTARCRGFEKCKFKDPNTCDYLKEYSEQLNGLNFEDVIQALNDLAAIRFCDQIVLVFWERSDNECSPKTAIIKWFRDHGVEIHEFVPQK